MKRSNVLLSALTALGILGITNQSTVAQTTIFSDTFGSGSNVQTTPGTPTASSTTYEWFQQGGAPATPTIASGDLHLAGRNTASSITGMEALFTSTPVTLSTVGQYLNFTITFVNNQTIFPTGSASTLNIGLYNSHGSAPVTGVRLDSFGSGTGGAIGWNGYVARIGGTGGANSAIFTRPPQTGDGSTNKFQDVLFNGASGSSTYNNPTGTLIATTGGQFNAGLTAGQTYTLSYTIQLTAAGTLTINNNLFDSGNNLLLAQTGTTSSSIETTYDALGFGWRFNSTAAASSVDVSSINVTEGIAAVPEPTVGAFILAGLGSLFIVRRFRHQSA